MFVLNKACISIDNLHKQKLNNHNSGWHKISWRKIKNVIKLKYFSKKYWYHPVKQEYDKTWSHQHIMMLILWIENSTRKSENLWIIFITSGRPWDALSPLDSNFLHFALFSPVHGWFLILCLLWSCFHQLNSS